jgi:hypothetical protein
VNNSSSQVIYDWMRFPATLNYYIERHHPRHHSTGDASTIKDTLNGTANTTASEKRFLKWLPKNGSQKIFTLSVRKYQSLSFTVQSIASRELRARAYPTGGAPGCPQGKSSEPSELEILGVSLKMVQNRPYGGCATLL